jgi:hypothetical protein
MFGIKRIRELEEEVKKVELENSNLLETLNTIRIRFHNLISKNEELENEFGQLKIKYCDEVAKRVDITEKYLELEGNAKGGMVNEEISV